MTNFIFKSQGTYKKLVLKLEIIQSELRHQRVDMAHVLLLLDRLTNNVNLQKTVDDFYAKSDYEEECISHPNDEKDLD